MKVNYRRAILRFFLSMSAMFLVIATTSGCIKDDGGEDPEGKQDDGKTGKTTTCDTTEGYKIEFANEKFEKAFVVGEKDGDLDRTIEVKVDQLTRANGFGAMMPEFKSLYATMDAANDAGNDGTIGDLVKENDGVIGLWGSYFVKDKFIGIANSKGHGANAGLSPFILGLNMKTADGATDGSGEGVAATNAVPGFPAKQAHAAAAYGAGNAGYGLPLTSGPAGLNGANVAFKDYAPADNTPGLAGGVFRVKVPINGIAFGWGYTSVGRLENFPAAIDAGGNSPVARVTVFNAPALVGGQSWELDAANKGDTKLVAAAAGIQNTYDHKKGWQKLFTITPCDPDVKNGLIAAQLTKLGAADEIATSLTAADKLSLTARRAAGSSSYSEITTILSTADAQEKRAMYVDSFVGYTIKGLYANGFATINYNLDAATDISEEKFHTVTKLALSCRSTITGISHDQEDPVTAVAVAIDDVKADKFTGGAEKMDCYLGITNVFPEWYQGVVAADKAANGGVATNTLDKQFEEEKAAGDRKVARQYDTQTKTVGLVIANTGDVVLNSVKSHALFYTDAAVGGIGGGAAAVQQPKWADFIGQDGVKTTYGTLTFKFVRPDSK